MRARARRAKKGAHRVRTRRSPVSRVTNPEVRGLEACRDSWARTKTDGMQTRDERAWNNSTDPGPSDWDYGWSVWALPVFVAVILVIGAVARWLGG